MLNCFFQFSLSLNLLIVTQQSSSWGEPLFDRDYGGPRGDIAQTEAYVEEGPFNRQREIPFHEDFCRVPVLLTSSYYSALTINFYFAFKFLEPVAGCLILSDDTTTTLSFLLSNLFFPQISLCLPFSSFKISLSFKRVE